MRARRVRTTAGFDLPALGLVRGTVVVMNSVSPERHAQLQVLARFHSLDSAAQVAKMVAAVAPYVPRSGSLLVTSSGMRAVCPVRPGSSLQAAVSSQESLVRSLGDQVASLGVTTVETHLVDPDDASFVDLSVMSVVDAQVVSQFAAWMHGWEFVGSSPAAQYMRALPPSMVLSRYCHLSMVVVGALAWTGTVPTPSLLASWADQESIPGDWALMTTAAAHAASSVGYSAVFDTGELVDVNVMADASLAVAAAAARELARRLHCSQGDVVDVLAGGGPNSDLWGALTTRPLRN